MSLTNPPNTDTTAAEITQLQNGIQFKSTSDAAAIATKVNDPNSGQTVFSYASGLISGAINTSQTAVGVWSLMTGATPTVADLTSLSTNFLPAQSANAVKFGFTDVTSYTTEALAFSLSTLPAFAQFTSQSNAAFAQSLSTLLSVNIAPINDFIKHWTDFYQANPIALKQGATTLTLQQAVYGATFGDAFGAAVQTVGNPFHFEVANNKISPNGVIANALIDNAEGTYKEGVSITSLPTHVPLRGEVAGGGTVTTFTFTPQTDTFPGTAGDDLFQGTISGAGTGVGDGKSTLSPAQFDKATGGGGNDTINLIVAAGGASLNSVAPLVTGVKTWSIDESAGAITDAGGLSVSQLQGATFINQQSNTAANFSDFTKVGAGQTVGFSSTQGTNVTGKNITVDTGNSTATVKLGDVGNVSLNFKETTASSLTKIEVSGKMGAAAAATLDLTVTAQGVQTDVFSLDKTTTTTKTTITITPGAANALDALKTIDASGSAANLTLDISGANFKNVTAAKLGSGDDIFTDSMANRNAGLTITEDLGSGKDLANLNLNPTNTNIALNINLGTGADTVVVTTGKFTNIKAAPTGNLETQLVTIAGFVAADGDSINITGDKFNALTSLAGGAAVQADIAATATTVTQAAQKAATLVAAANTGTWFDYKGDAYIFDNAAAGATFDAGDGLIKLVGVTANQLANPAVFQHT